MAVRKVTSKINTWKPKPHEEIIVQDGKLFVCMFDRVFGYEERLRPYNRFLIGKESYINQLETITSYTNFFVNNYDPEHELVMGYLKTKFALDKEKLYNVDNMQSYIDFLYEVIFTDGIIEKVIRMVEENYLDDIESPGEGKKKYIKNEKKHLESLEFTNQHIKILLQISFSMKIMAPCIFHYIQLNNIRIEKDSDIIFRFYEKLFEKFGYSPNYELRNLNGELIRDQITKEEMDTIVKERELVLLKNGQDEKWYTEEDGEEVVYQRARINMYNKLYVYVKEALAQTLKNLFNCWNILRA